MKILSKFLLKLIGGINVTTSLDDIDIEIKMPTTSMLNETNEIFSAGLKNKKLENYVKEHLHKKVFILIDLFMP